MIDYNDSRRTFLRQAGAAVTALLPFSGAVTAARAGCKPQFPGAGQDATDQPVRETWWVSADPHVGYPEYDEYLRTSVQDVNGLESDYAIVLGDLFEDDRSFLPQFLEEIGCLNHGWTYVLGNHDYDRKSQRSSGAPILPVNYFSRQIGPVRIIALSDEMLENRSHVTELGRNQDRWFKDVLDDAPDMPTIIMTHHCPLTGRRSVSAFEEWLADDIRRYNIVLWIVGHAHRWAIDEELEGFGFDRIKVASLCRKHGDGRPCEGALLTIEAGQDRARISMRFRNHLRREWISVLGREAYELEIES